MLKFCFLSICKKDMLKCDNLCSLATLIAQPDLASNRGPTRTLFAR